MRNVIRGIITFAMIVFCVLIGTYTHAEEEAVLTLPTYIQTINEKAFYGNTSLEKLTVPEGAKEIKSKAFANCSLKEVVLPDTLTFIAEDAFDGCEGLIVYVPEDCYAYERCIEIGLIVIAQPTILESEHPYADNFDYTWIYDAGEGTESITLVFSTETETEEEYDYIYIYTLDDVEIGKYSGTELAGQSIVIDGMGFKIRLTSDEPWGGDNDYFGFAIDSVIPKKAIPLSLKSISANCESMVAGSSAIIWTVETTGGKAPVFIDYTILHGDEQVAAGTVEASNTIEYLPICTGEYRLSVILRDSGTSVLAEQMSDCTIVYPSITYPESEHPYSKNTDQQWVYAAEQNVESMKVTFSADTKTESRYDYILLYDQNGTQIGKYDGTTLAGQTIEIMGNAFVVRLTSDGINQYYGFSIANIEKYIPGPLTFVSLTSDKTKAKTGDLITWTMETDGGCMPVRYDYVISLGSEILCTGSVIRPETISYVPMEPGDYKLSVVTVDAEDSVLDAQTAMVRITERGETAGEYFTVEQISGNFGRITSYTGTDTAVVIPVKIGGYTIEAIGNNVFKNNSDIISISLPSSIKSIGSNAFSGCKNLQSIKLNSGLEMIYSEAFANCTSLTEIYIPDSVTTLSYRAFYGCSKLAKMNYPMGWVTTYSYYNYISSTGSYGGIFAGTALKTLYIPEGATVPAYAFKDCTNFSSIIISETGVGCLGGHNFENCTGLTSMVLPDNWQNLPESVFSGCTGLVSIDLPETLEIIYSEAFANCTSLTEIYIPDSVTTLSYRAFYGCSKLAKMNYPMGWVTTYSKYNYISSTGSYGGIFAGTALKTLYIPEGATVPAYAFKDCTNFTYFELPDSLQSIPVYALAGCTNLEKIWIPESVQITYDEKGNVVAPISSNAFSSIPTSTLTIHGVAGSYAQTFANEYGYTFVTDRIEYTPASISGSVVDKAGAGISGVAVTVYKGPTTDSVFAVTYTDANGAWSIEDVKVGNSYTIGFAKEGYRFNRNNETIYNVAENQVYATVVGEIAPNVLDAVFLEESAVLGVLTPITVQTDESAQMLFMYAENRDFGRCGIWTTASDESRVIDGVRIWNVEYSFNTPGDRTLYFAASTDGDIEGDEKSASILVVEAEMDVTVKNFELSKYIAEPDDTISISGIVNGSRDLGLVTVSLCPNGDRALGVEIWSSAPFSTTFDLSEIPDIVVGETYSGMDYVMAQAYNEDLLLNGASAEQLSANQTVTMVPGVLYEVIVDAALTDGTTIEAEQVSRTVVVRDTTVYTGEVATRTSEAGKAFIKSWESCHLSVYDDGINNPTIGWGHKILAGEEFTTITKEEADALFDQDLLLHEEDRVNRFLALTGAKVNQQQYDALSSFFYNGNSEALESSSCMFKLFSENANNLDGIPDWRIYNQLANYHNRKNANVRVGLFKRRLDEARIFTEGVYSRKADWIIEDWVRNGEPVPDTWCPQELSEHAEETTGRMLEAPSFVDYPQMVVNGVGFTVSWEPVENASYYKLWYSLNTWGEDEKKYITCENESCYLDIDIDDDATCMWLTLYAMDENHFENHSSGTTIQIKISDMGDLMFSNYTLGQTSSVYLSEVTGFLKSCTIGWECKNAVKYKYRLLVLPERPVGDDQSGVAEATYEGIVTTAGMKIPSYALIAGKYLKLAVAPVDQNGTVGTWRWIGLYILQEKTKLAAPKLSDEPDEMESGENYTITWEPVEGALYYNLWYSVMGENKQCKQVYAPECSAVINVQSAEDSEVWLTLYALTSADNCSKSDGRGIPIRGKGIVYASGVSPLTTKCESALLAVMRKRHNQIMNYSTQIYFIEGYGVDLNPEARSSAMCVVIKDGIVTFTNNSCATLPDQPFHAMSNPNLKDKNDRTAWDDQPNVVDGVYEVVNVKHSGYPALKVLNPVVYRIHSKTCGGGINGEIHGDQCGLNTSGGIHIHKKSSERCEVFSFDDNGNNTGWVNSSGCSIVPTSAWSSFASAVGFTNGKIIDNTCVVYDRGYAYANIPEFISYMQLKYTDSMGYAYETSYYDENAVNRICGIS